MSESFDFPRKRQKQKTIHRAWTACGESRDMGIYRTDRQGDK